MNEEAVKKLGDEGANIASNPSEVASKVDRIITMLPNSQHVHSCYAGDKGVFQLVNNDYLYFKNSRSLKVAELKDKCKKINYMDRIM